MAKFNINVTKSIFVLLAIILVLTRFRLLWLYIHKPSEQVLIENGVLDLSDSEFTDITTTLHGEWMFFPNQLIYEPEKIENKIDEFSSMLTNETDEETIRFGTYYTKIILPDDTNLDQLYSIRIPSMKTASALYVNGHLRDHSGIVAASEDKHVGKGNPYVTTFPIDSNEVEVVLQVSNFDTSQGISLGSPIKFGLEKQLLKIKLSKTYY